MTHESGYPGNEAASLPPKARHESTLGRSQNEGDGSRSASVWRAAFVLLLIGVVAGGTAYLAARWTGPLQDVARDMRSRLTAQKAPSRSEPPPAAARRPQAHDGGPSPEPSPIESREPLNVATVLAQIRTGDLEQGTSAFKMCSVCHPADRSGQQRLGPNLWGIIGGRVAAQDGYRYSAALRAKGGTWTYERLAEYLYNPRAFAPGTSMAFWGFRDQRRMANLIAYMRTLADRPQPLPD